MPNQHLEQMYQAFMYQKKQIKNQYTNRIKKFDNAIFELSRTKIKNKKIPPQEQLLYQLHRQVQINHQLTQVHKRDSDTINKLQQEISLLKNKQLVTIPFVQQQSLLYEANMGTPKRDNRQTHQDDSFQKKLLTYQVKKDHCKRMLEKDAQLKYLWQRQRTLQDIQTRLQRIGRSINNQQPNKSYKGVDILQILQRYLKAD